MSPGPMWTLHQLSRESEFSGMDLRGDSQAAGGISIPPRDSRAWELMFSGKDVMLIGENNLEGSRPKGLTSGMQPREGT